MKETRDMRGRTKRDSFDGAETVKSGEVTKEEEAEEKISTTAGDSFYVRVRELVSARSNWRGALYLLGVFPHTPPIFPALRIARYIDGIRQSDRFKGLDRWRPTG